MTESKIDLISDKTIGALLALAAGDAMGWITEFIRSQDDLKGKMGVEKITQFHNWAKQVGGRFQGYQDKMIAGDYSDDTQLTICTAVCIFANGKFDYKTFCDYEYPMWLEYARGAGGTVKEAAKKIQRKSAQWNNNFFSRKIKNITVDYRDGGANGAVMRISPHVLANIGRWEQAEFDIWRNSIISHGHPRAIIGSVLYGYALYQTLHWEDIDSGLKLIEILGKWIKELEIPQISDIKSWIFEWNKGRELSFETVFNNTKQEAISYLRLVYDQLRKKESPEKVVRQLGCFSPETKGSGLSTAIASIYLFAHQPEKTSDNIILATNMIGTDTDSIAAMAGALGGAAFGIKTIPDEWIENIQDSNFLKNIGYNLAQISIGEATQIKLRSGFNILRQTKPLSRIDAKKDLKVIHKRLGEGIIIEVESQSLLTKNNTITIITVEFDIGQKCKFPFRNDTPSETIFVI